MTLSFTTALKEPVFHGTPGYTPLALESLDGTSKARPLSYAQMKALPYQVFLAEVRHYMTIREQVLQWRRSRDLTLRVVENTHANRKPIRSNR